MFGSLLVTQFVEAAKFCGEKKVKNGLLIFYVEQQQLTNCLVSIQICIHAGDQCLLYIYRPLPKSGLNVLTPPVFINSLNAMVAYWLVPN